jgi:glycerophosphoryl diester phosphodiesterase
MGLPAGAVDPLRFPLIRPGREPVVVAHRGSSARAPENTLAAFRLAFADGVDWVEADVQPTADGVPVLLHDDDLTRTTGDPRPVRAVSAGEVAALDAGRWFGPGSAGEPVPPLAALLAELTGSRRLLLEVKGEHDADRLATVLAAVDPFGNRVAVQSFEVDVLVALRRVAPDRPLALLVEHLDDDPVSRCRELAVQGYHPPVEPLRADPVAAAALVDRLRAAGTCVAVWTVDDPGDWGLLRELGVDAVITNVPDRLARWLADRT